MKNILLILCALVLGLGAKAQDFEGAARLFKSDYFGTDSLAVIAQMSELAAMSGCKYIAHDSHYRYLFKDTTSTLPIQPEVIFTLGKYYKDRNLELGRLGELHYGLFMDVYGSFLGLLPIYKKYFNPAIDEGRVSESTGDSTYIVKPGTTAQIVSFNKVYGSRWLMRVSPNKL